MLPKFQLKKTVIEVCKWMLCKHLNVCFNLQFTGKELCTVGQLKTETVGIKHLSDIDLVLYVLISMYIKRLQHCNAILSFSMLSRFLSFLFIMRSTLDSVFLNEEKHFMSIYWENMHDGDIQSNGFFRKIMVNKR